jgi:transcriptional regulator with XRE-family HTH domain
VYAFARLKTEPSDLDKGIGSRLRQLREQLKISRTAFALEIGIGSERLASYETGRVPLRWEVFCAISRRFFLNPFWLATGKSVPRLEAPFDEKHFETIDPRGLFSDAMLDMIAEGCEPQDWETMAKINRLGHLLAEIAKLAQEGGMTQEAAEKLHESLLVWRKLGRIMSGKVKASARRRDTIVKCGSSPAKGKASPSGAGSTMTGAEILKRFADKERKIGTVAASKK